MTTRNNAMINFDGQTIFKVLQSGTFTIPDTVSAPSPSGLVSSGYAPTTAFDGRRNVAGGMLYGVLTDIAGNVSTELVWHLNPADVIALSAAGASSTVSVNGVVILTIASTAVFGVLGFYG